MCICQTQAVNWWCYWLPHEWMIVEITILGGRFAWLPSERFSFCAGVGEVCSQPTSRLRIRSHSQPFAVSKCSFGVAMAVWQVFLSGALRVRSHALPKVCVSYFSNSSFLIVKTICLFCVYSVFVSILCCIAASAALWSSSCAFCMAGAALQTCHLCHVAHSALVVARRGSNNLTTWAFFVPRMVLCFLHLWCFFFPEHVFLSSDWPFSCFPRMFFVPIFLTAAQKGVFCYCCSCCAFLAEGRQAMLIQRPTQQVRIQGI